MDDYEGLDDSDQVADVSDEVIEDLPDHVMKAEQVLDLYGLFEPIVNWDMNHLVSLRDALEYEIRSRGNAQEN